MGLYLFGFPSLLIGIESTSLISRRGPTSNCRHPVLFLEEVELAMIVLVVTVIVVLIIMTIVRTIVVVPQTLTPKLPSRSL